MQVAKWALALSLSFVGACGNTKKMDGQLRQPSLPIHGWWTELWGSTSEELVSEVVTEDGYFQWPLWPNEMNERLYEHSLKYFSFKDERNYRFDLPSDLGKLYRTSGDESLTRLSFANNTVRIHSVFVSSSGKAEDAVRRDVLLNLDGMKWTILAEATEAKKNEDPSPPAVKIPDVDPKFQRVCKENPLETDKYIFFFGCSEFDSNGFYCEYYSSLFNKVEQKWYQMGKIAMTCHGGHKVKWKNNAFYVWGGYSSGRLSRQSFTGGMYRFDPEPQAPSGRGKWVQLHQDWLTTSYHQMEDVSAIDIKDDFVMKGKNNAYYLVRSHAWDAHSTNGFKGGVWRFDPGT